MNNTNKLFLLLLLVTTGEYTSATNTDEIFLRRRLAKPACDDKTCRSACGTCPDGDFDTDGKLLLRHKFLLRGRVLILQMMDVMLMRIAVAHVLVDKTLEMLVRPTIIAKRVEDLARLVRAI